MVSLHAHTLLFEEPLVPTLAFCTYARMSFGALNVHQQIVIVVIASCLVVFT